MNENRSRWLALYVLCLGDLMIVLDSSIVNVALPSIQSDLGFSQTALAWVVNAYLLTFGGFLLLSGRLGDLLGNKRVFQGGVMAFTDGLRAVRAGSDRRAAGGRPGDPGPGRRRGLRRRAVADHGSVLRPGRAGEGDGLLRLRDVRRRRGRRAGRRRAHRPPQLALDLPGQRPDRHRRLARRPHACCRPTRRPRRPAASTSRARSWSPSP